MSYDAYDRPLHPCEELPRAIPVRPESVSEGFDETFGACGCGDDDKPADAFEDLNGIFSDAIEQALGGKGVERHGVSEWEDQAIHAIPKMLGKVGAGFLLGQGIKKAAEAAGLPSDRAYRELLGSIVYLNRAAKLARHGKW